VVKWFLIRPAFLYPRIYAFFCYYRKKERRREIEERLLFCNRNWDRERIKAISMGIFERRGLKKLNRRLIPLFDPDFIARFVETEGLQHLDRALGEGKGVVLMSGHFGNPHLSINAMRTMGYPVKVLKGGGLRKEKTSRFEYYESWDNTVFVHDRSRSDAEKRGRILDILRSGGILYQMADATEGKKKEYPHFMGKEMGFPTGLIHLAFQARAALVPLFHFYEKGRLKLIFKERIDDAWQDGERVYGRIVARYATLLESCILAHPEQYIGIYGPTVLDDYVRSHSAGKPSPGEEDVDVV
jgi:Kdo2-lipid IVA lauroyltransferase/acyltransferase